MPPTPEGLESDFGAAWRALERALREGLAAEAARFVRCSLVARGGAKALHVREELQRYVQCVAAAAAVVEAVDTEAASGGKDAAIDVNAVRTEVLATKHRNLLRGARGVCRDFADALQQILKAPKEVMFLAGDNKGNALCLPKWDLAHLLAGHRETFKMFRPEMAASIEVCGWPPPAGSSALGNLSGTQPCRVCAGSYRSLWVHHGVCCVCEPLERRKGRCPFNSRCSRRAFCSHDGRCASCDLWSCEACRLVRGDGEDVMQWAGQWAEQGQCLLFLDFDRTLCTTKGGGAPTEKHSLDAELVALATQHSTRVVTRNSHQVDIEAFLAARGLEIPVSSVKKLKTTKAAVILDELDRAEAEGRASKGLFVDDDIRELTVPELADDPRLLRVLFVRGGL